MRFYNTVVLVSGMRGSFLAVIFGVVICLNAACGKMPLTQMHPELYQRIQKNVNGLEDDKLKAVLERMGFKKPDELSQAILADEKFRAQLLLLSPADQDSFIQALLLRIYEYDGDGNPDLQEFGGNGCAGNLICSVSDFDKIRRNLAGNYRLKQNINFDGIAFAPIGGLDADGQPETFTGTFEGDGNTLQNLNYDSQEDFVGLFRKSAGRIRNLKFQNARVRGKNNVGIVVGQNDGLVELIDLQDSEAIGNGQYVGGISGSSTTNLKNLTLKNIVISGNGSAFGGVVGQAIGIIEGVKAEAIRLPGGGMYRGGLVGHLGPQAANGASAQTNQLYNAKLTNVEIGSSSTRPSYAGGLVGRLSGATISNSFVANGRLIVNSAVGGLAGEMLYTFTTASPPVFKNSRIEKSWAQVDIQSNDWNGGGFVGRAMGGLSTQSGTGYAEIVGSYVKANMTAGESSGGFIGEVYDGVLISNCFAQGSLSLSIPQNPMGWHGAYFGRVSLFKSTSSFIVSNSYNSMTLSSSGSKKGAIAGELYGTPFPNVTPVQSLSPSAQKIFYRSDIGLSDFGALTIYLPGQPAQSASVGQFPGMNGQLYGTSDSGLKNLNAGNTGWSPDIWEFIPGQYPALKNMPAP